MSKACWAVTFAFLFCTHAFAEDAPKVNAPDQSQTAKPDEKTADTKEKSPDEKAADEKAVDQKPAEEKPANPAEKTSGVKAAIKDIVSGRPLQYGAGISLGSYSLAGTDSKNGSQGTLGGLYYGVNLTGRRIFPTKEYLFDYSFRLYSISPPVTTRTLATAAKMTHDIAFTYVFLVPDSQVAWEVGGKIWQIPYFSNVNTSNAALAVDTILNLGVFGGARLELSKWQREELSAELLLGIGMPMGSPSAYTAGMSLWQMLKANYRRQFKEKSNIDIVGSLDIFHAGESTTLESQSRMSVGVTANFVWRLDP